MRTARSAFPHGQHWEHDASNLFVTIMLACDTVVTTHPGRVIRWVVWILFVQS